MAKKLPPKKRLVKKTVKARSTKPAPKPITSTVIEASGLVQATVSRGRLRISIYSTAEDALGAGLDPQLVAAAFRTGGCTGTCRRGEQRDKNGKLLKVWCVNGTCSVGSSCQCHLIRMYRNGDGDIEEDDMGRHDDTDQVTPDGTSTYVCRCV